MDAAQGAVMALVAAAETAPGTIGTTLDDFAPSWFSDKRRDAAPVFETSESERSGRVRRTAHTAFDDPATGPGARPRESIEIRALAFF
jgi:hypothetical protein